MLLATSLKKHIIYNVRVFCAFCLDVAGIVPSTDYFFRLLSWWLGFYISGFPTVVLVYLLIPKAQYLVAADICCHMCYHESTKGSGIWWYVTVMPAVGSLRQENHHKFKASLISDQDPLSKIDHANEKTGAGCFWLRVFIKLWAECPKNTVLKASQVAHSSGYWQVCFLPHEPCRTAWVCLDLAIWLQ